MEHPLTELFVELDAVANKSGDTHALGFADIVTRLNRLMVTFDELEKYAQFGERTYRRNLLHAGVNYQVLLLCWRAGQRSPIHDHVGSACGVKIVRGAAVETLFSRTDEGWVYAASSRTLECGSVVGSFDADIHQVSNLQARGSDLVTLHIYSPPLLQMNMYSLTSTLVERIHEPVYSFTDGDGI